MDPPDRSQGSAAINGSLQGALGLVASRVSRMVYLLAEWKTFRSYIPPEAAISLVFLVFVNIQTRTETAQRYQGQLKEKYQ
jgi:hypothetical protein